MFCAARTLSPDTLTRLNDGLQVVAKGSIRCVSKFRGSQYQLNVRGLEIDSADEGCFEKRLGEWRAMLSEEGVFDDTHKRPLPTCPQRVAVVTSADGAVLHDIRQTLADHKVRVEIKVCNCSVQGVHCVASILEQLQMISEQCEDDHEAIDMVLIARGGGSREDLWEFNQPLLLRGIDAMRGAGSLPPVACAIGHQTDTPLLDDVCDVSFITPTYAAQHVAGLHVQLRRKSQREYEALFHGVLSRLHTTTDRYNRLRQRVLQSSPLRALHSVFHNIQSHVQYAVHAQCHRWRTLHHRVRTHQIMASVREHCQQQYAGVRQLILQHAQRREERLRATQRSVHESTPWSVFAQDVNWVMLQQTDLFSLIKSKQGVITLMTACGPMRIKYESVK